MPVKEEKTRITLTIDKSLDEKIEKLAKYMNTSKNSVIVNLVSTTIDLQINMWSMMKDPTMLQKMFEITTEYGSKEELKAASEVMNFLNGDSPDKEDKLKMIDDVLKK